MRYYPKSQLVTDLYTNGDEYLLSTTQEPYTGDYYETFDGNQYTGKSPNMKFNVLLVPINLTSTLPLETPSSPLYPVDTETNSYYPKFPTETSYLPQFNSPIPTPDDYKNGSFTRYFCKKTNGSKYLEINQETYNKLLSKDSTILWALYEPFSLPWKISSNASSNSLNNQSSITRLVSTIDLTGFESYIKGYTQYTPKQPSSISNEFSLPSPPSPTSNLSTLGGEFKTQNGKEYVGPYHIHPDKGPMVGAVHVDTQHSLLLPITGSRPSFSSTSNGGGYSSGGGSTPSAGSTPSGGGGGGGGGGGY